MSVQITGTFYQIISANEIHVIYRNVTSSMRSEGVGKKWSVISVKYF